MVIPQIPPYRLPQWGLSKHEEDVGPRVNWAIEPSRSALLIHDMQAYFLSFFDRGGSPMRDVLRNINEVRARCREKNIPVFYSAQPPRQSAAERALLTDMWGPGLNSEPIAAAQIVNELTPGPKEIVLTKWRYSAFVKTNLKQRLRAAGRDQLILCGVYASIGCLATSLDAYMMDIECFLIADATADFNLADHDMALRFVQTRCGRVLSAADTCAFLVR